MATKKSSRKKKNSTSRRNIIFLIIATVLSALIIWATISTVRQQQLEREDREKFAVLESDMSKLKSQLDATANAGEWKLDKYCEKPRIKFYTGEAGSCHISVVQKEISTINEAEIKRVINEIGYINAEGYAKVAGDNFIEFTFSESREKCSVYFSKLSSNTIEDVEFFCSRSSLHMYYPER